jgi:FkbM family methyltransferase
MNVIYDIGANNGDDIPYYLMKADFVVAVEANPELCIQLQKRFAKEIQQNRLIIENCVLTAEDEGSVVPFYVHKSNHVLSQFPRPLQNIEEFEQVFVAGKSVGQLFKEHGSPYYIKIDIEHYDHVLLRSLFSKGINPKYISAESHSIEVFCLLASLGGYNLFKIVDGATVVNFYHNWSIATTTGESVYSFPYHSAGPFGEDVAGDWINSSELFFRLVNEGLGWKDIHAKCENNEKRKKWNSILPWQVVYWHYQCRWNIMRVYNKIKRLKNRFSTFFT